MHAAQATEFKSLGAISKAYGSLLHAKFYPHQRWVEWGRGAQKLKMLPNFTKFQNINASHFY